MNTPSAATNATTPAPSRTWNESWVPVVVPATGSAASAALTMAVATAVPMAPPSCWMVLNAALPSAWRSSGRERRPLVMEFETDNPWQIGKSA